MQPGVDPWRPQEPSVGKLSNDYIKARRQVKYRRHTPHGETRVFDASGVGVTRLGIIIMGGRNTRVLVPWSHVMEFMYSDEDQEAKRVIGEIL